MRARKQLEVAKIVIALFVFHSVAGCLRAEDRVLAAILPSDFNKFHRTRDASLQTLNRPSHFRDGDAFYAEYFAPLDHRIAVEYKSHWAPLEYQEAFASSQRDYVATGTLPYGERAQTESEMRRDFAQRVMRLRADAAFRTYFAQENQPILFRRASRTLNRIKDMPVSVSEGSNSGQLRFGYDVYSDGSKIEYAQGMFAAGLYHPHLISAMTGQYSLRETKVRLSAQPGLGLPSASLAYQFNLGVLETVFTRPLNRSLTAEFNSYHPVQGHEPTTVVMKMIYSF